MDNIHHLFGAGAPRIGLGHGIKHCIGDSINTVYPYCIELFLSAPADLRHIHAPRTAENTMTEPSTRRFSHRLTLIALAPIALGLLLALIAQSVTKKPQEFYAAAQTETRKSA
jgi:hypothetical protein